jgi:hypothetical protein
MNLTFIDTSGSSRRQLKVDESFMLAVEARSQKDCESNRQALRSELIERLASIGLNLNETVLDQVLKLFQKGIKKDSTIQVASSSFLSKSRAENNLGSMTETFFDLEVNFPSQKHQDWYELLMDLDGHKEDLLFELEMLLYPETVNAWAMRFHKKPMSEVVQVTNRSPLIILEGDVGTGKTALASTIGDKLARYKKESVILLKLNTQVRGSGLVGEMSTLMTKAFNEAEAIGLRRKSPVILLVDEADAVASRRDGAAMHHEDRAGINTLLQKIDNLKVSQARIAVIFITNMPKSLDPAMRRRASLILHFRRPSSSARIHILRKALPGIVFSPQQVEMIEFETSESPSRNDGVPFTSSDITDRLIPTAIRACIKRQTALNAALLVEVAKEINSSPQF